MLILSARFLTRETGWDHNLFPFFLPLLSEGKERKIKEKKERKKQEKIFSPKERGLKLNQEIWF